ncbi:unnamed protein product [Strongylus vulgaris]|uniref:Uncharacterized protein n=1 Tax=Strongylus vulgaris TaxID=40348 RepID=A0A3P7LGR9_STRVU|nr:unnamed protein product [Strongylus vulgaris]
MEYLTTLEPSGMSLDQLEIKKGAVCSWLSIHLQKSQKSVDDDSKNRQLLGQPYTASLKKAAPVRVGQLFNTVGVYLSKNVFSNGQLFLPSLEFEHPQNKNRRVLHDARTTSTSTLTVTAERQLPYDYSLAYRNLSVRRKSVDQTDIL